MYRYYNPNPANRLTNDCVIRAITKALDSDWTTIHDEIAKESGRKFDTMDANHVWIGWLKRHGYKFYPMPDKCPDCYTVKDFSEDNPRGQYILGTGTHVVTVQDGDYYDTFDSGDYVPVFYMRSVLNGF